MAPHILIVVRRRDKDCRQREKGYRQRWKLRMLKSTDNK